MTEAEAHDMEIMRAAKADFDRMAEQRRERAAVIIHKLCAALDGCIPALEAAAALEAEAPAINGLRPVTEKMRLENANRLLARYATRAA